VLGDLPVQPALQITDSFIPHILTLAGLHWKVP